MHNWLVARFPLAAQEEAFSDRPWVFAPAPLAPTGVIEPSDGGFRLEGTWKWATGISHADWVIVHAVAPGETFATRFVLVPAADVEVRDVWFMSGMLATGSNTVVAKDVFVPEHRTVDAPTLLQPSADDGDAMSPLPVLAVLALVAAAPALGASEAALEFFRDRLLERRLAYTTGARQSDSPAARVRLAAATADVRAAAAL
jgi:alkylation response protein AidB-like acyl-CoA dehydrogenase